MPDAVQAHVDSPQAGPFRNAQRAIFDLYEDDIAKYVEDPPRPGRSRWSSSRYPASSNAPASASVRPPGEEPAVREHGDGVRLALGGGRAIEATRVGEPSFPLLLSEDRSSLKLFMGDVGPPHVAPHGRGGARRAQRQGERELRIRLRERRGAGARRPRPPPALLLLEAQRGGRLRDGGPLERRGHAPRGEVGQGLQAPQRPEQPAALRGRRGEPPRALVLCDGNVESRGDRAYVPVYAVSALLGRRA